MGDKTKHEKFWFDQIMQRGARYVMTNWSKFSHQSKERIFLACMNKAVASKTESKNELSGEIEVNVKEVDISERQKLINERFACTN